LFNYCTQSAWQIQAPPDRCLVNLLISMYINSRSRRDWGNVENPAEEDKKTYMQQG